MALFRTGQIVTTNGIARAMMLDHGFLEAVRECLTRHCLGDWGGGDVPSKLKQKLLRLCFRINVVAMWGKTFPALRKSRACRVCCLSTGNGKKRRPPSANNYHDP